ncbi:hypothetical protein O0I10_002909 [Lichtheimia ornata]|uniref:Uncharacterized protein n=1 Tax=Lichtheimia ornata TaxID=688661 RepID=A0AAD7Y2K9_9FUNG|nr:uncharacterized protein O0I10_002909 [Lichtheimia ornata]KAJ8661162.1 hypothetical protein O0I10_002909 [Lichtheimia ornata]
MHALYGSNLIPRVFILITHHHSSTNISYYGIFYGRSSPHWVVLLIVCPTLSLKTRERQVKLQCMTMEAHRRWVKGLNSLLNQASSLLVIFFKTILSYDSKVEC